MLATLRFESACENHQAVCITSPRFLRLILTANVPEISVL